MGKVSAAVSEVFQPKIVTCLKEGYDVTRLRADALAGLTVAIVALPLSMAIAIASGASPERGLYAAIVGGFLISLLGGSRHQIGGPAGAFIVLVAAVIERHGLDGMFLATIMAGAIMIGLGTFRLGTLIRYIPEPVIIGFTAGIAVIIFASQLREILGLALTVKEPAALVPKLGVLWQALPSVNPYAIGVATFAFAIIKLGPKVGPSFPGFLVAVIAASALVWGFNLPVETVASRFGVVPSGLPAPAMPPFGFEKIHAVAIDALAIALLGSIESLLSAVVADSMTGRRHRSNTELIAQGFANIITALFGGLCATGTIARTATNVRSGGTSPIAGILHALFLLGAMMIAAPLMGRIPLAALGALLAVVAWNMAEKHAFAALLRGSRAEAAVLLATFLLTVFRDLTEGIIFGVLLGAVLFAVRMARLAEVSMQMSLSGSDGAAEDALPEADPDSPVMIFRLEGPLFFGTAPNLVDVLGRAGAEPKAVVFDFGSVPFIDATGVAALERHVGKAERGGTRVYFAGVSPQVELGLRQFGLPKARVPRFRTVAEAYSRALLGEAPPPES
ncbi:MAG TPA: SulP family inorganic anion transporter [Beijerinckiaceae bacterium]|nr:SulP family inorganic anion transporter [Beijerinckiaceae bacterium]